MLPVKFPGSQRGYTDNDEPVELYNLKTDIEQRFDLATKHPNKVKELQALLQTIKEAGYADLH